MKNNRIKILLVSMLLTGCTSGNVYDSGNISSANQTPDYDCRTINYYDYSGSVPKNKSVNENEYLSDSFFAGDSRMGSVYLYSDLSDKGAYIQYSETLTVYTVDDLSMVDSGQTLYDLLMSTDKSHIYLMIGINELWYDNFDDWSETYDALIKDIRTHHESADIYLLSCYKPRSISGLSESELSLKLTEMNAEIKKLAEDNFCYYLDTDAWVSDENGNIKEELTWDGLHLNAEGAQTFADQILLHTVNGDTYVKEICE